MVILILWLIYDISYGSSETQSRTFWRLIIMAIGIPLVIVGTMLEQACRRYFPNVSLDWLFNEKKHKWISLSSVLLGATFLDVEAKSAEAIQFLVISSFGLFAIWFGTFFINGDRHRRLIVGWSLILFALWVVIINRA